MFFLLVWTIIIVGAAVHVFVDRSPRRRSSHRVVELALLWVMVAGGAASIFGGIGHVGPNSGELAGEIGYRQSMFQWEVGWADIAIGVLGLGCVRWRDGWLSAAVVALTLSYGGDAIGHVMEWVAHDNTATDNIWAIPSDVLQPLVAIVLLVAYRRGAAHAEVGSGSVTAPAR